MLDSYEKYHDCGLCPRPSPSTGLGRRLLKLAANPASIDLIIIQLLSVFVTSSLSHAQMLPVFVLVWQWEATIGVCHGGGAVSRHCGHTSCSQGTTDLY